MASKRDVQKRPRICLRKTAAASHESAAAASDEKDDRKRAPSTAPKGMKNQHTAHMRQIKFGQSSNCRTAGAEMRPSLSEEAAGGRLFHTGTSVALDVTKYGDGYDSDAHEARSESDWLSKVKDERLFEVIDMLPLEKYYFGLWNKFVLERGPVFDRDMALAWKHFLDAYGSEVMRMQMEALVAQHIVHCWDLGLLDAQEVFRLTRRVRNFEVPPANQGEPPPVCTLANRLLADSTTSLSFYFPEALSMMDTQDQHTENWMSEQRNGLKRGETAGEQAENGMSKANSWMAEMVRADPAEPPSTDSQPCD